MCYRSLVPSGFLESLLLIWDGSSASSACTCPLIYLPWSSLLWTLTVQNPSPGFHSRILKNAFYPLQPQSAASADLHRPAPHPPAPSSARYPAASRFYLVLRPTGGPRSARGLPFWPEVTVVSWYEGETWVEARGKEPCLDITGWWRPGAWGDRRTGHTASWSGLGRHQDMYCEE